jgi:hypothetical protein
MVSPSARYPGMSAKGDVSANSMTRGPIEKNAAKYVVLAIETRRCKQPKLPPPIVRKPPAVGAKGKTRTAIRRREWDVIAVTARIQRLR